MSEKMPREMSEKISEDKIISEYTSLLKEGGVEITDEELAKVAGGWSKYPIIYREGYLVVPSWQRTNCGNWEPYVPQYCKNCTDYRRYTEILGLCLKKPE